MTTKTKRARKVAKINHRTHASLKTSVIPASIRSELMELAGQYYSITGDVRPTDKAIEASYAIHNSITEDAINEPVAGMGGEERQAFLTAVLEGASCIDGGESPAEVKQEVTQRVMAKRDSGPSPDEIQDMLDSLMGGEGDDDDAE